MKALNSTAIPAAEAEATALAEGIDNLLFNCAGMAEGESLLVLHEDPSLGWYDAKTAQTVGHRAEAHNISTTLMQVGGPSMDLALPAPVAAAMAGHRQTIFFARLGDQSRFRAQLTERPPVMCYIAGSPILAAPYGRFDYRAFCDLKSVLDTLYRSAGQIRITCPLGTDLVGCVAGGEADDVGIKRFPLGINAPIPAAGFAGRVALTRFLTSTGSRHYDPPSVTFDGVVYAHVDGNRITGFDGPAASIGLIKDHYNKVAATFGIDPLFVHSWHAGMHPGCCGPEGPSADPDRWGNRVFQNPRILHFHTCGAYPPGEISWMVIDPIIEVDSRSLWNAGRLNPALSPRIGNVLEKWPGFGELFAGSLGDIGP